MATNYDESIISKGTITARQGLFGPLNRDQVVTDMSAAHPILPQEWRIWDAYQTPLTTAGSDDLGISAGAFGTGCPYVHAGDMNAAGAITRRARTVYQLPVQYVAAGTVKINFVAGMLTSVCSVSATVDVEVYVHNRNCLITGSDLVTTAATTINSLVFADVPFTLTSSALTPGVMLDIRVTIAANSATASSHFCAIALTEVLFDRKG